MDDAIIVIPSNYGSHCSRIVFCHGYRIGSPYEVYMPPQDDILQEHRVIDILLVLPYEYQPTAAL